MEMTRRDCLAALCLGGLALDLPALAQDNTRDAIELSRAEITNKRQEILTKWMDFTPEESNAFWPIYREYQADQAKIGDQLAKLLDDYISNYSTLTDDVAMKTVNDWLKLRKQRIEVQQKYVGRFKKVLPGKKVARLYQLENAMDAVVSAGVQGSLPLLK